MKIIIASLAIAAAAGVAQADLIASWNFNNIPAIPTAGTPTALGITSIAASNGAGTVSLTGWGGTIDDFSGSLVNAYGADVAGVSLSLIAAGTSPTFAGGNGTFITFNVSLTGFENPIITFATQRTSTGFNSVQFAWSTDGATFTDFGAAYNPATAYALQSFDLTTINALDGAASATFRLTFSGATSSSGNNRIDNLQVNATAVPTPSAAALMGVGILASARRRRA